MKKISINKKANEYLKSCPYMQMTGREKTIARESYSRGMYALLKKLEELGYKDICELFN